MESPLNHGVDFGPPRGNKAVAAVRMIASAMETNAPFRKAVVSFWQNSGSVLPMASAYDAAGIFV